MGRKYFAPARKDGNTLRLCPWVNVMHRFSDDVSANYGVLLTAWRESSTQFKIKLKEVDVAARAMTDGAGDGPSAVRGTGGNFGGNFR